MRFLLILFLAGIYCVHAQDVQVEYDKHKDLSAYKTFRFGDSEIVTTRGSKKISDVSLDKIIRETVTRELKAKGIEPAGNDAQLIVTYMSGTFRHSEVENLGPLGGAPGQAGQTFSRNFTQGSLVIDLNDAVSDALIWRINSTANANGPEARREVERVVAQGFRKFNEKPKEGKGKRKKH